jgi:hypothetical protein
MAHIQYGCGFCAPPQWLNFDASPTLRLQKLPLVARLSIPERRRFPANVRYGDILRGLPVKARSSEAVYCSHVLEHLSLNDFRVALTNTRQLLAERGIFRLVVPDLRTAAERYLADSSGTAAVRFMTETILGTAERSRGVGGLLRAWLGNSRHLWMWDYESLSEELTAAGFTGIRPARAGDSEDPNFAAVEEASRWVDAVGIQCYG